MTTHRHIDKICIIITVLALVVTSVFMVSDRLGVKKVVDEDAEGKENVSGFTSKDMDGDWDSSDATVITLNGDDAKIKGQGAYVLDGSVYITGAGYYAVSGELTDGSIYVDAYDSSKVWILLDGVNINRIDSAAIYVKQAEKVFLTLADGSTNTLKSGANYSDEALNDGAGGVIYTHDDLTINGTGSLDITAEYKHGIESNDSLVITGGKITVTAPEDGFHVNDEVNITEADITIHASDDGIHSDTSFLMASGSLYIDECYEGIEALTIDIIDGNIEIYCTDDGMNANGGSSDFGFGGGFGDGGFGGGRPDGEMPDMTDMPTPPDGEMPDGELPDMTEMPTPPDGEMPQTADKTKNQSEDDTFDEDAESWIHISGGSIYIENDTARDADGLDSNGDIIITGGELWITLPGDGSNCAIDYGSESGGVCEINGGNVIACGSSSMVEDASSSSTQCNILYIPGSIVSAGTTVSLKDEEGNTLLEWEVPNSFSAVTLSHPDLKIGSTYTIVT
ncbi:MAG: carbohydrate-binding domain-containing protein, partial [Lachnospiraceae bacterium]|nr:carbohydrate-binding domain-containing protein [Lachnospiraceae bacterium]